MDNIIDLSQEKCSAVNVPGIGDQEFRNGCFIAAEGYKYSLDDFKTKLNNNVIAAGGSGTGKTTSIAIPNIKEAVGSYYIIDPKGQLYKRWGKYLIDKGYKVKLIDFTHPERSDGYNPLYYLKTTQDITKIAAIITDSKESDCTNCDPYWDRMTILLLCAIIGYMIETHSEDMTFKEILRLVELGEREDEYDKRSELQKLFKQHKAKHPDSWACEKFESVDTAPIKTYDTIRSTLVAKFSQLDSKELRDMMSKENFDFAQAACEKTAVFVTVSDTDRSMDTLVNIFFSQAMNELCQFADNECKNGRLPVPVRFILDDFATNCRIEEFPRMISSIRSRGISVILMIQSEAQLWQGYDQDALTIISNCDTYIYLGGNDLKTAKSICERCDKPLSEILYMPVGYCWVFRRGSQPVYAKLTNIIDSDKVIDK